ncbi:unnamed protein product [Closterium sp. Naga37s-1]|nr:unnamed protein product [Closterium sp. Naga37s-1]
MRCGSRRNGRGHRQAAQAALAVAVAVATRGEREGGRGGGEGWTVDGAGAQSLTSSISPGARLCHDLSQPPGSSGMVGSPMGGRDPGALGIFNLQPLSSPVHPAAPVPNIRPTDFRPHSGAALPSPRLCPLPSPSHSPSSFPHLPTSSAPHLLLVHRVLAHIARPPPPPHPPALQHERTVTGKLRGAGCPVAILLLKGAQREKQVCGALRDEERRGMFLRRSWRRLTAECLPSYSCTNQPDVQSPTTSGSRITSTSHRLSLPHQSHRPLSPASHAALTSPPLRTHLSLPCASASLLISSLTFSAEHSSLLFTCLPHPPSLLPPHSPPSTPPLPSTPPSPSPSPSPCLPLPFSLPLPVPLPLPLPFPLSPSPPQSITGSKALHRQYLRHHVLLAVPAAPRAAGVNLQVRCAVLDHVDTTPGRHVAQCKTRKGRCDAIIADSWFGGGGEEGGAGNEAAHAMPGSQDWGERVETGTLAVAV